MGLNLAEKAIFTKRIDAPMIRYKNANILIRCIRISQNLIFFLQLPFLNDFITLFLSFFSALLLSLPFAFHILSGSREKLGVKFGQNVEMGPWWIMGIVGYSNTIFAPKLITLFNLLRQNAVDMQSRPLYG